MDRQAFLDKFILAPHSAARLERRKNKLVTELGRLPDSDRKAVLLDRVVKAANSADKNRAYHDLKQVKRDARQAAEAYAATIDKDPLEQRISLFEAAGRNWEVTKSKLTTTLKRIETMSERIVKDPQQASSGEAETETAGFRQEWDTCSKTWQDAIREYEAANPESVYAALSLDIAILGKKPGLAEDGRILERRASVAKAFFQRGGDFLSGDVLKAQLKVEQERFDRLLAKRVEQGKASDTLAQLRSRLGAIESSSNLVSHTRTRALEAKTLLDDYKLTDAKRVLDALAVEAEAIGAARSDNDNIKGNPSMKLPDGTTLGERQGEINRLLEVGAVEAARAMLAKLNGVLPFAAEREAARKEIEAAMQDAAKKRELVSLVQAMDDAAARGNYGAATTMLEEVLTIARLTEGEIAKRAEAAAKAVLPSEQDEAAWAIAEAEWKGKVDLKQYSIAGQGGKGGMGAIHFLKPSDARSPKLVLKTGQGLENEAQMYEKIGAHPNIARCLGIQEVGGKKGLVMEALSGGDMSSAITEMNQLHKEGKISEQDYWGIMQYSLGRTLEALAYMEKKGVVHKDIKPPNIVFDEETSEPKVVDFGISAEVGKKNFGSTPGYSPADPGGAKSKEDSFAVGASAFEVKHGNTGKDPARVFAYGQDKLQGGEFGWVVQALAYKKQKQDGSARQALRVSQQPKEVFDNVERNPDLVKKVGVPEKKFPVPEKKFGVYGAETSYVDFVNWLLHPDPAKRPTPAQALQHPFMQQRMLDDGKAREASSG